MLADLSDFLSPLLRRLDRTSMGASVECRVPFLDHRLVHRAINLPLDYKVGRHADKWILKQVATRYFSGQLVTRKKMGFPLPLEQYLEPLADLEFFKNGFCEHTLGLSRRGLAHLVASWRGLGARVLRPADARDLWTAVLHGPVARASERAAQIDRTENGCTTVAGMATVGRAAAQGAAMLTVAQLCSRHLPMSSPWSWHAGSALPNTVCMASSIPCC